MERTTAKTIALVLVSAVGGIAIFVVGASIYLHFVGPELGDQMIFYDEAVEKSCLAALDKAGVAYRKGEAHSIWYSPRDKEKVRAITEAALSKLPVEFLIGDAKVRAEFVRRLNKEGIAYTLAETKNGTKVLVSPEDQVRASKEMDEARVVQ